MISLASPPMVDVSVIVLPSPIISPALRDSVVPPATAMSVLVTTAALIEEPAARLVPFSKTEPSPSVVVLLVSIVSSERVTALVNVVPAVIVPVVVEMSWST